MESQRAEAFKLEQKALNQKITSFTNQAQTDIQIQEKLAENPVGNAINQAVGRENFNVGANLKRIEGVISTAKTLAYNEQTNAFTRINTEMTSAETKANSKQTNAFAQIRNEMQRAKTSVATTTVPSVDVAAILNWAIDHGELPGVEPLLLQFTEHNTLSFLQYIKKEGKQSQYLQISDLTATDPNYIAIKQLMAAKTEVENINTSSQIPRSDALELIGWALEHTNIPGVTDQLKAIDPSSSFNLNYLKSRYRDPNILDLSKVDALDDKKYAALKALQEGKDAFKPYQQKIDQITAKLESDINSLVLTFKSNKYLNSGLENARSRLEQLGIILQNSGDFLRTVLWGEAIATPVLIFGAFAAPLVGIPATVAVGGGALILAVGVGIYKIIKALRNKVK